MYLRLFLLVSIPAHSAPSGRLAGRPAGHAPTQRAPGGGEGADLCSHSSRADISVPELSRTILSPEENFRVTFLDVYNLFK